MIRRLDTGRGERASTVSMTMLGLTIVSMIVLVIATQSLSSMFTTKQKQERSVGMAAADSGIEKIRVALQSGLADETDGFTLSKSDLEMLVKDQEGADVIPSDDAAWGMKPQLVDQSTERYTVRERTEKTIGYWQVYNVIEPFYTPGRANDLVVYVRAWATSTGANPTITTQPKVFRAEYRPGLFSDYQFVSDAPLWVFNNSGYTLNGPVHSNGYEPNAAIEGVLQVFPQAEGKAIFFNKEPVCGTRARFSSSRGTGIVVPGASCSSAMNTAETDAREVSLLGARRSFEHIQSRCGRPGVICPTALPRNTVRLLDDAVQVNGTTYPVGSWRSGPDSRSLTVLLAGDVTVSGFIRSQLGQPIYRLTIANRRTSDIDRAPNIYLSSDDGVDVGVIDPPGTAPIRDSVGLITEGSIIMPMREPTSGPQACLRGLRVAAIAAAGSLTIPPEWVLPSAPPVSLQGRACTAPLEIAGSVATHGQLIASLGWFDQTDGKPRTVGYTSLSMRYVPRLYKVPPPFYPTTLPWAMTTVQDADARCLDGAMANDPYCGT